MKTNLSSCCNAEVRTNTKYYSCSKCLNPCDPASPEVIELTENIICTKCKKNLGETNTKLDYVLCADCRIMSLRIEDIV